MENFLNTTLRNVAWFNQVRDNNELEVKPPFQRNPVWVNRQKSYLIDTILNKYPIPEIYMQETVDENGKAKYIIVDGQQRIRSVLDFISGLFCLDETDSPQFDGAYFQDLSNQQKIDFFQYNFVVRILPNINDKELRAIFQRLNKNVVALNKQELRQATYSGAFIKTMNAISDKDAFGKIGLFTANDIRRMLDVEYISELTIALLNGIQNKKDKLESYYQLYEENAPDICVIKEKYDIILGEILKILPDIHKTRWCKKTDFYSLFLVLGNHIDALPLSKDSRNTANNLLINFGENISRRMKVSTEEKEFPEDVENYAKGMRATSDYSSRVYRNTALENVLVDIW